MIERIRQWAGKVGTKEIARRLGISRFMLVNHAAKHRISLRTNWVFTPAVEAEIRKLVGTMTARERLKMKYMSLLGCAETQHVVFTKRRPKTSHHNVYFRLAVALGLAFPYG